MSEEQEHKELIFSVININQICLSKNTLSHLVENMLNKNMYSHMLDIIDSKVEEDYSGFSDFEMMYLFVHQETDQDERKNKANNTKKEYLRELVWTYSMFINQGNKFDFDSSNLDVYTLLKNIKRRHIRKYQDWLKTVPYGKGGKPYSIATISRKTGVFKSFMRFLYTKRYIKQPLHESFRSANVHRRDRPNRDLHSEEAIQLLSYYKEHPIIHSLLSVLLTTGARINEICAARMCDLSYGDGGYWLEVIGKGNEKRELFIFPNVFETIVKFRKRRGLDTYINPEDTSPIFMTARNKAYTYKYLSNYLSKAIMKADIPFVRDESRSITPHTLRHGFAIISAEEGTDVYRIMQALGHKKMETTMIYLEKHAKRKNHAAHNWKDSNIIKTI